MAPKKNTTGRDVRQHMLALALVAGMCLTWWDSFHETGRFFMRENIETSPFLYSSLSCFFKPTGIVIGCLAGFFLVRKYGRALSSRKAILIVFLGEFILHVLYYLAGMAGFYLAACLVYATVSACVVANVVMVLSFAKTLKMRQIALMTCIAISIYGLCNNLLFPYIFLSLPLAAIGATYLIPLAGAAFLSLFLEKGAPEEVEPEHERGFEVRTPSSLIVHLLSYGSAFGILHILGGYVAQGPHSVNIAVFFACCITTACVGFLFLRKTSGGEIWSKVRSTVFPLSVIGYLLIPLVSDSDIALALTEASNLLYGAIFFIGCIVLSRKTGIDPYAVIIKGLFWKYLGTAAGIAYARLFYDPGFLEGNAYSVLSVIITVLLSIATFWVGSDERIRKIWGLRKNLPAKHYRNMVNRCKCEKIAHDFRLTAREKEVLLFASQGMRPSEIAEAIGVSVDTIRSHSKHLYAKLDVHSATELRSFVEDTTIDESELAL
ncbi:MAG: helix-turn-helix transcriptional regulator [Slackia sp.]|nr:helix-turn-helix transcriptional regulator [Slackia sp.]